MTRDLIEKYGAGHRIVGVRESTLKKSLRARNVSFSVIGAVVVTILGVVWILDPMVLVIIAVMGVTTAACIGIVRGLVWTQNELPGHLNTIKQAKSYGVLEDED